MKAALATAAGLGMFFRLPDPRLDEAGWQPAALLYTGETGPLDAMLDDAAARLGGCERRVAASLLFQGYAARLLSPQVGCLVTSGCVPAVPTAGLRWRRPGPEVVQLGLAAAGGWRGPADALIGLVLTQSFDRHLSPLTAAVRARAGLPASLLRDNAASSLVGALRLADGNRAGGNRPRGNRTDSNVADSNIVPGWRYLAEQALAHPRLHGSGTLGQGEPAFVRRSCCLYYRVDNGGMCGDCPLAGRSSANSANKAGDR